MPTAAIKLNQLLEADDASPIEVEMAVVEDPALTFALLRAASSPMYGPSAHPITTVRTALVRIGSTAVKALALSIWTQALVNQPHSSQRLSPRGFTDHATFVGYMARYLFSCRMHRDRFVTRWSPDEILAAGVLHDLGTALLAAMEPETFDLVCEMAASRQLPFSVKFKDMYDHSVHELGVAAVNTWGLDPLFAEVIGSMDRPEAHATEAIAISCIHLADRIANANHHGLFNYPSEPTSEFAQAEVGLPEEDVASIVSQIASSIHGPDQGRLAA
jgi:HD-like signal output (HDOD) protein